MTQHTPRTPAADPNPELLRSQGWAVATVVGEYCVAWRGSEELVWVWRNDGWQPVASRISGRAA